MMEEELPARPKGEVIGEDLSRLSVHELEARMASLKAEMARIEAEIKRRQDVRSAAEALFRRPAG